LGSLQAPGTNGGTTPTMAIPMFSSAMGAADASTSLQYDQRFADRPQADSAPRNGYDIGAYEVCRRFSGANLVPGPCSEAGVTVTTTADHDYGACTAGDCTLREAINAANDGLGTIVFASGVTGTIT